ncbi:MAG: glycosyltransferase [Acidobacteria bacterium]|nr:glycosyltransferase [Acidobacteriota bacterium]
MAFWQRLGRNLPLLVLSPAFVGIPAVALAGTDLWLRLRGRKPLPPDTRPVTTAASIVIPNWNGRDLLEKYLPSVLAAAGPANEVIVVDDASTDGSADFVAVQFPSVRLIRNATNLGFGGGSNAGFRAARHDIVVLLNSDMRVEPDFLAPLLAGFTDEKVFAVSCQIFFSDPQKVREETGLTQAWWENGGLRVRHRIDEHVDRLFPCFYGGGGSCAFDRRKFLALGGFDELLKPFYLEDTDLGMMAWKRGWKVLYQPASRVFHEHRGTIGKKFSPGYIQSILKKNFLLFCWKNIHESRRLAAHFAYAWAGALLSLVIGDSFERPNLAALCRAFLQLPHAMRARARAYHLAAVSDTEAFRRPLPGYFFDRFEKLDPAPAQPRTLFLSPYPILPPIHGGAVFMSQTLTELVKHVPVHLIVLLDEEWQRAAHEPLAELCATTEYFVRLEGRPKGFGSLTPYAVREFANDDLRWAIHRTILLHRIDVLQIEYTNMGQYAEEFRQVVNILFEHDVYFQSIGRSLAKPGNLLRKIPATYEYLRALRYELTMLPRMDRIQMCSRANESYLAEFAPALRPKMQSGLRAGIDTKRYRYQTEGREPDTLLFLGSFRHVPNSEALNWFLQHVWPLLVDARPTVQLIIIGSDPPPRHSLPNLGHIELIGFVDDVRDALARYALFICPILTGSGVRVKLLEAYAAGMPVVSTTVGAEGLAHHDGDTCALADEPPAFAERILRLLADPAQAAALAERARAEVVAHWDMATITRQLAETYREAVREKRAPLASPRPTVK